MSSNRRDQHGGSSLDAQSWHAKVCGRLRELSQRELVDDCRAGRISRSTMVWRDGMRDWEPLDTVPELVRAIEPAEEVSLLEQLLDDSAATGLSAGRRSQPSGAIGSRLASGFETRDTDPGGCADRQGAPTPMLLEVGEDETTDIDSAPRHTPCCPMISVAAPEPSTADEDSEPTVVFDPGRHAHDLGNDHEGGALPSPREERHSQTALFTSAERGVASTAPKQERRSVPPSREHLVQMRKARHGGHLESSDDEKTIVYTPSTRPAAAGGTVQPAPESTDAADSEPPTLRPPGPNLQRPRSSIPHRRALDSEDSAKREGGAPSSDVPLSGNMVALPPHAPPRRSAESQTPTPASASVELDRAMQLDNERSRPAHTSPALRALPTFRRVSAGGGAAGSQNGETLTGVRRALVDTQLRQRRSLVTVAVGAAAAAAVVTALLVAPTDNGGARGDSREESASQAERSRTRALAPRAVAAPAHGRSGGSESGEAKPSSPNSSSASLAESDIGVPDLQDRRLSADGRTRVRAASARETSSVGRAGDSTTSAVNEVAAPAVAADSGVRALTQKPDATGGEALVGGVDSRLHTASSTRRASRAPVEGDPSLPSPSTSSASMVAQTRKPRQPSASAVGWDAHDPGF